MRSDHEYIMSLEQRVEVLTKALREAVEIIRDTGLDATTQQNALNRSDDIDAVFRWSCSDGDDLPTCAGCGADIETWDKVVQFEDCQFHDFCCE